jgi:hypothetical protein
MTTCMFGYNDLESTQNKVDQIMVHCSFDVQLSVCTAQFDRLYFDATNTTAVFLVITQRAVKFF